MTAPVACQRWQPGGRQAWRRPADGLFSPAGYGVAVIPDADAKTFVESRHYAASYVAAVLRYGLFDLTSPSPMLVGAAVFSNPTNELVLTNVFPHLAPYRESLELGRFVLDEQVAFNGESWFLGQAFRLAHAAGLRGVVSFSDPVPRHAADGTLTKPGHIGVIYQATNAAYLGRSTPGTTLVLRDGTVFDQRTASKIRGQESGHEYAERRLIDLGARPMRGGQRPADWLPQALDDVGVIRQRHPGKHRYGFRIGLNGRDRDAVVIAMRPAPYPKKHLGQLGLFGDDQ